MSLNCNFQFSDRNTLASLKPCERKVKTNFAHVSICIYANLLTYANLSMCKQIMTASVFLYSKHFIHAFARLTRTIIKISSFFTTLSSNRSLRKFRILAEVSVR